MRNGDFGVEVIPTRGAVRELDSGRVLVRPGEIYALRLRNYGPLRCVAEVRIDGKVVTAGGLVLDPWSRVDLERPIDGAEHGRFTVVAEGNESVFGPDGGRDNSDLGLIDARFRRELPRPQARDDQHTRPLPSIRPRPMAPPGWSPDWLASPMPARPRIEGIASRSTPVPAEHDGSDLAGFPADIERAAGTGLTGHSSQEFLPIQLGPLESEATVVQLRIVIGTPEAIDAPRPLPEPHDSPARPAARP